ncbi:MAG: DivIVA domain-containing protein [Ignavibacteria bacterium]|nr:DivIVA domain-containing protein [Ignavibacteria bacterium]
MKLTPLDIRKQEFRKVMRGYDPVEVDTFVEMVSNEFEEVLKEQREMRDRVTEVETELRDYRQIEKTLQQTLLQAQETTGKTYEAARRESESILREAELKSVRMQEEAAGNLSRTNEDIRRLQAKRAEILSRLRLLLSSELELLKTLEPGFEPGAQSQGTGKESIDLDDVLEGIDEDASQHQN